MLSMLLFVVAFAATPSAAPLAEARGAFFALSVPDADAAAGWYQEKLGLEVIMRPPESNGTQVLILAGGGLMIELIEQRGATSLKQLAPQVQHDTMVHGVFKAGVIVDNWDGLVAGLKARGVPIAIGPFPASAEQRANLIIRDGDGNYIQFIDSRPARSEQAKED
jgi:catechol 2,3-dioxygenase-like lactoylglutathione lyase family enzyme